MEPAIITAIISGTCVAIPNIIATIASNYSAHKKAEETKNLTLYRIDELERKVDKHNNLIDRMYKIENRVTVLEEKER